MSTEVTPQEIAVKQIYFIPPNVEELLKPIHAVLHTEPPPYIKDIGQTFAKNIEALISTLGIPFDLTYELVHNLHWQRFHIAERIRSRYAEGDNDAERIAANRAKEKFNDFLKREIGTSLADEVVNRLAESIENPHRLASAQELIRQGVLLLWSAFEVLCRDLFVESLNRKPILAERLLNSPTGKKRFMPDKMDWATLSGYGYDVSSRLGDILSQRADLDDIVTVRDAYLCLAPANIKLAEVLLSEELWLLYQRRNLIVHKRAIVDYHYLERTSDSFQIGTILSVTSVDMERILSTVVTTGACILEAIGNET
jgi:hypothetical protein